MFDSWTFLEHSYWLVFFTNSQIQKQVQILRNQSDLGEPIQTPSKLIKTNRFLPILVFIQYFKPILSISNFMSYSGHNFMFVILLIQIQWPVFTPTVYVGKFSEPYLPILDQLVIDQVFYQVPGYNTARHSHKQCHFNQTCIVPSCIQTVGIYRVCLPSLYVVSMLDLQGH